MNVDSVLTVDSVAIAWKSKYAHGWVFNGHGEIASGWGWWATYSGGIETIEGPAMPAKAYAAGVMKHKLVWVHVIACGSAAAQWERLVSPNGVALLYSSYILGGPLWTGIPTADVVRPGIPFS